MTQRTAKDYFLIGMGMVIPVLTVVLGLLGLGHYVDGRIENKLNNPEFVRMVADKVRLPFVVFDQDKSVIADTGAMDYIDKIEINKGEMIISPKRYMAVAPILESFDAKIEFEEPIRGENFDFIYRRVEMAMVWADRYAGKAPKAKFRLQLITLPAK